MGSKPDMMEIMLRAIVFVIPALLGFWIFLVHLSRSPSLSYRKVKSRMLVYSIILFLTWVIGMSILLNFVMVASYPVEMCTADGVCVPDDLPTITDHIQVTGWIAFLGLIPATLQYILLVIYHHLYAKYDKSKRKPKNDQKASQI